MMKYLLIIVMTFMVSLVMYSQDFSYVKDVELNDGDQLKGAQEDVLECCYYLVAARYNKNDEQRILATDFVSRWVDGQFKKKALLNEKISRAMEDREELNELFLIYYALRYIEEEGSIDEDELREAALTGVIKFCENPVNKIKLTKELKNIKQMIEEGKLSAYLEK